MEHVQIINDSKELSYQEAISVNDELKWRSLGNITVAQAFEAWLHSLKSYHTRNNYRSGLRKLVQHGILNPDFTLQQLVLSSSNSMLDRIRQVQGWSEGTIMSRSGCLLSFFRFLNRRTDGLIKRIEPSREGESKTFYKIRDTVVTESMTQSQWVRWLDELRKANARDWLIARVQLQGAKRISEVLTMRVEQIDFANNEISFEQSKSRTKRRTVITYPQSLMDELKAHIGDRKGLVFLTSMGNQVSRRQIGLTYAKAGERANIPFRVSSHVLRASAITYLKAQGYSDSQIRMISGHASGEAVSAYDKRSKADNISKQVSLV